MGSWEKKRYGQQWFLGSFVFFALGYSLRLQSAWNPFPFVRDETETLRIFVKPRRIKKNKHDRRKMYCITLYQHQYISIMYPCPAPFSPGTISCYTLMYMLLEWEIGSTSNLQISSSLSYLCTELLPENLQASPIAIGIILVQPYIPIHRIYIYMYSTTGIICSVVMVITLNWISPSQFPIIQYTIICYML